MVAKTREMEDVASIQERSDLRAGGAIGSAVARAFAREGAKLYLTGRSLAKIAAVAKKIAAEGGAAEAAEVDALNEQEITKHAEEVANKAGSIDISGSQKRRLRPSSIHIPSDGWARLRMWPVLPSFLPLMMRDGLQV